MENGKPVSSKGARLTNVCNHKGIRFWMASIKEFPTIEMARKEEKRRKENGRMGWQFCHSCRHTFKKTEKKEIA
jgi:hypothetical protein